MESGEKHEKTTESSGKKQQSDFRPSKTSCYGEQTVYK